MIWLVGCYHSDLRKKILQIFFLFQINNSKLRGGGDIFGSLLAAIKLYFTQQMEAGVTKLQV
jgi:hypothetical protein